MQEFDRFASEYHQVLMPLWHYPEKLVNILQKVKHVM